MCRRAPTHLRDHDDLEAEREGCFVLTLALAVLLAFLNLILDLIGGLLP